MMHFLKRLNVLGNRVMLCVHDLHFVLEVQDVNCMIANTDALEVLKHLSRLHPLVKGNQLTQIRIPRLVKCVDDGALCFSLRHLEHVPVGDAGAMYGFVFGTDHTGRAVGDRFVVYCQVDRTWERYTETIGVVRLVHYEANEILFPPFLVKMYGIEKLHWLLYNAMQVSICWLAVQDFECLLPRFEHRVEVISNRHGLEWRAR